jgi:hypothetical protein
VRNMRLIVLIAKTHDAFVNIAGATIIVRAANGLCVTVSMRKLYYKPPRFRKACSPIGAFTKLRAQ